MRARNDYRWVTHFDDRRVRFCAGIRTTRVARTQPSLAVPYARPPFRFHPSVPEACMDIGCTLRGLTIRPARARAVKGGRTSVSAGDDAPAAWPGTRANRKDGQRVAVPRRRSTSGTGRLRGLLYWLRRQD